MNFHKFGPPCCMPRPKMMRTSWTLRGRLQHIPTKGLFQNEMKWWIKMTSPKVMNILWAHVWDKWLKISKCILMKAHVIKMRACDRSHPRPLFFLGQTHMNGWSCVIVSQNGGLTDHNGVTTYLIIGINKKIKIKKFLILLICKWIYIDHKKLHDFGPRYNQR